MVRLGAAVALDLLLLAGGAPLACGLARLVAGALWPWAAVGLWLAGAAVYVLGLRLSPLRATLGQDLLRAPLGLRCPRCGQGASADARFCRGCGADLALRRCPACSRDLAADARFCGGCGKATP